jgi:hypothetical protein
VGILTIWGRVMNTVICHRQVNCRRILAIAAGLLVLLLMTMVNTQKVYADAKEYSVKAAFLFNFVKFIEWPDESFKNSQSPIVISFIGKDPFGDALNEFRGKTINGRTIVIHRVPSVESLERSHVIFVSKSEKDNLPAILKAVETWHTLTVGDMKSFAQSGGIINLVNIDNKIGFEINVGAAEKARLKVSSKLLKLSKIVYNN